MHVTNVQMRIGKMYLYPKLTISSLAPNHLTAILTVGHKTAGVTIPIMMHTRRRSQITWLPSSLLYLLVAMKPPTALLPEQAAVSPNARHIFSKGI